MLANMITIATKSRPVMTNWATVMIANDVR